MAMRHARRKVPWRLRYEELQASMCPLTLSYGTERVTEQYELEYEEACLRWGMRDG